MRWIFITARFWLGLWMLYYGLNWWFRFSPQPIGIKSQYLHLAFMHSGLFSVAKITEALMGLSLLTNRYAPLMCVLAFPVTFNVAWVHFVLEGPHLSGYFVLLTHLFLLFMYLPHYRGMLAAKGTPLTSWEEVMQTIERRGGR
jgi:putative oxidoreductase